MQQSQDQQRGVQSNGQMQWLAQNSPFCESLSKQHVSMTEKTNKRNASWTTAGVRLEFRGTLHVHWIRTM